MLGSGDGAVDVLGCSLVMAVNTFQSLNELVKTFVIPHWSAVDLQGLTTLQGMNEESEEQITRADRDYLPDGGAVGAGRELVIDEDACGEVHFALGGFIVELIRRLSTTLLRGAWRSKHGKGQR